MKYYEGETKPEKSSFRFLAVNNYCDEDTVLNIYCKGKCVATFRNLYSMTRYLEDDILDEWSLHHPERIDQYIGVDFEQYIFSTFKAYMRGNAEKFHNYRILLEYKCRI